MNIEDVGTKPSGYRQLDEGSRGTQEARPYIPQTTESEDSGILIRSRLFKFFVFLIFCGVLAIGIHAYRVWSLRTPWDDNLDGIGLPYNTSYVEMKECIHCQWKWHYDIVNITGEFKSSVIHRCPSTKHDADLFIGRKFVAGTDGKIVGMKNENTKFFDYTNVYLGNLYVKNVAQQIYTGLNYNLKADYRYADGTVYATLNGRENNDTLVFGFNKYFEIIEKATGDHVGYLVHESTEKYNIWRIIINKFRVIEPEVLILTAGILAFSDGDNQDYCNKFAVSSLIACGIVVGVLFLAFFIYICNRMPKFKTIQDNFAPSSSMAPSETVIAREEIETYAHKIENFDNMSIEESFEISPLYLDAQEAFEPGTEIDYFGPSGKTWASIQNL